MQQDDRQFMGRRALLAVLLACWSVLAVWLAYQVPAPISLHTDGLGDQPFVQTTEAQRDWASHDGYVYPDEMDASGRRFRWTRGRALIQLPGVGAAPRTLTLEVAGWPADLLRPDVQQPIVHVLANAQPVGIFTPTAQPASYTMTLPTSTGNLTLDLRLGLGPELPAPAATTFFTATLQYPTDLRPHGVRLYSATLSAATGWTAPPRSLLLTLIGLFGLLPLLWQGWRLRHLLLAGLLATGGLVVLTVWQRLWLWAGVQLWLLVVLAVALWAWRGELRRWLRDLRELGQVGAVGSRAAAVLVLLAALICVPLLVALAAARVRERDITSISIVVFSLIGACVMLLGVRWRDGSARLARLDLRLRLRWRWSATLLACLLLIWAIYMLSVITLIPYLGNADYSDNGVVARNLVAGRGWTVDYVTQFYQLNPGGSVVRAQATWPLLQPVWIAPFFAVFGATAWAAKLPNLLMMLALALLIYRIGGRLWDRRVGLLAVLLVLLNKFYFRLQIYSTSDLGFALFYLAAMWTLWLGLIEGRRRWLPWSGVLLGLMVLQKPSGAVVAVGMGLWAMATLWRQRGERGGWVRPLLGLGLRWVLPALLVFSPYIVRNIMQFGQPIYSTESYDAWILEYAGADSASWEQIYSIHTTEGGLPGDGVPDRSWLLRWGWERVIEKVARQVRAVRDYLLPASPLLGPLSGKGSLMGNLGDGGDPTRWLMAGAWLALAGLLLVRGRQARWVGLVATSFGPYLGFLVSYWHINNEERYLVPLIPVLALLAASAVWMLYDAVARRAGGLLRPLGAALALALVLLMVQPGWEEARNRTSNAAESDLSKWRADLAAFDWLRANTPPDAVVMTRVPWQLTFHAERAAVMNPNTADLTTLLHIARFYHARYLLVNAITNNKGDAALALDGLLRGEEQHGFVRLAAIPSPEGRMIYIYAFPSDYNGVAPLTMEP